MLNLLQDDVSPAQLAQIFSGPRPALLPTLGAPEWTRAADNPRIQKLIDPLRDLAREEANVPLPELTDELYAEFFATGVRLPFQRVYFERRRRLARAAILLLTDAPESRPMWRASLAAKAADIFGEVSWSLPAHVWWDASGKDPLRLDLFACETANLMGELLTVFPDEIPQDLAVRIRERLRTDVFLNFVEHPERHNWRDITNNWNAVCFQGVVGAALAVLDDPELLARVLMGAREGLPFFLSGFGDDGGCSEGPGYWGYGFGWFAWLNQQLETASAGALSVFEGDAKVREIALYAARSTFSNGYFVNFADGPARGRMNPALLEYLGKRLDLPVLLSDAAENYRIIEADGLPTDRERADFFYFGRLLLGLAQDLEAPGGPVNRDYYFPDLEVLTVHRKDAAGHFWEFAAKAGHNDEHHNHNDCGSYVLHVDGQPIATEIGAPEYTREFFGPTRYSFLATRTLGHALPIIDGIEQKDGAQYRSVVLEHEMGAENAPTRFTTDLTGCYPPEAGCRSLVRRLELDPQLGRLTVADEFVLDEARPFETAIVTSQGVEVRDGVPYIISGPVRVRVVFPGEVTFAVEEHEYHNHDGAPASIRRIAIRPASNVTRGSVNCYFELA